MTNDEYSDAELKLHYMRDPERRFWRSFDGYVLPHNGRMEMQGQDGHRISEDTRMALWNYFYKGFEPGGHLTAVLCNDLQTAVYNADIANKYTLVPLVHWLTDRAPGCSHGNAYNMGYWMQLPMKEKHAMLAAMKLIPDLFEMITEADKFVDYRY